MAKINFDVDIDLDTEAYLAEYGMSPLDETPEDTREFLRDSIQGELRLFVSRWPYIDSIEVK